MRIVLFGSNSSITQSLKSKLLDMHEVITLGRSNADIIVDINDISTEFKLPNQIDTIVLSSAHFGGIDFDDYLNSININIVGPLKLLDAAINAKIPHFIYISSIYSRYEFNSPLSTIYSVSKKCSEEILMQYVKDKSIKLTILRPSQIIGNYESNKLHHPFFYDILHKIKNSNDVIFYGKNNPKRNYIYIDDLSFIIYKVILMKLPGLYDCVFHVNTTYLEIANYAKEIYKSNSVIHFDDSKPDILDNVFNCDFQLYNLICYYPKTSIFSIIKKLVI
jgi:nucleoside-diphosphate-sugar epimerase